MTVQYGQDAYNVAEGATVNGDASPVSEDTAATETVIPVTSTGQSGATSADYSVPTSVTFATRATRRRPFAFMVGRRQRRTTTTRVVKLGFGSSLTRHP